MPYQKSSNNDEVTFNVQPEPYIHPAGGAFKWSAGCLLVPGGLFLISLGLSSGFGVLMIICCALGVGLLYFVYKLSKKPKVIDEVRIPKIFTVNSGGITIDGKTYKREDIQFISVRNPLLTQDSSPYVQRGYEGFANAAHNQKMLAATVNYWVVMETNGVPVFLGCGLNELAAKAIMSDVSNLLGMKIS